MNIVLLDRKTLGDDLDLTALLRFGELTTYETTKPQELLARISEAEIIITNKVVIDKETMEKTPSLKLICIAATGMNNVDLETAKSLNIKVMNVTNYARNSVVQHTFALALPLLERLHYYNTRVKDGTWSNSKLFTDISKPFFEISGKTWGIVGLGHLGKAVAEMAEAFGAKVHYYSTSGKNKINDYHHSELNELLAECEIISIHAPLNEATYNLINQDNLPLIKDGAVLINVGRGGIINEEALAMELEKREIYVGLDFLEQEPIDKGNYLLHISHPERLIITPHIAWTSIEARKKLLAGIVKNIETFIED
jgi:glycerate dehydrogenase